MSDWQSISNDKEKYAAYLCSREWGVLKQAVRVRTGGKCERCVLNDIESVHHLTYERKYAERLTDLQGLCDRCHKFTHGLSDDDPLWDIYRPSLEPVARFSALAMLVCPACRSLNTKIGAWQQTNDDGYESWRAVVQCDQNHEFDLHTINAKGRTVFSAKRFRWRTA